jgi:hypothetical protein
VLNGIVVPSASAWAFGGARVGETSELFDDDNGYFMARLDSIREGGDAKFENVKADVRARVAVQHQLDKLVTEAQRVAAAAATSSLEAAAQQANKKVEKTSLFARSSIVPGMGQYTEAVGAAFGAFSDWSVSAPVKTQEGVYVLPRRQARRFRQHRLGRPERGPEDRPTPAAPAAEDSDVLAGPPKGREGGRPAEADQFRNPPRRGLATPWCVGARQKGGLREEPALFHPGMPDS